MVSKYWFLFLLIVLVCAPSVHASFPAGFVHGYKFESDSSDINSTNSFTEVNSPTHTIGKFGNALNVTDSTSSVYSYGSSWFTTASFKSAWSVSTWVQLDVRNTAEQDVWSFVTAPSSGISGQLVVRTSSGDSSPYVVAFTYYDGSSHVSRTSTIISDSSWHNIIVTHTSGNTLSIYVDGVKEFSGTISISSGTSRTTASSSFGGQYYGGTLYAKLLGSVDSSYVYGYALSDGGCGVGSSCSGEVGDLYSAIGEYGASVITFSLDSPLNSTFTSSLTPTFDGNVTSIAGTWNLSLVINDTVYGAYNGVTSTGNYSIIPTSSLVAGKLYSWWYNASSGSTSYVTEKRSLYITGGVCSSSPSIKTCVFSAGSIAITGITCG